jgi:hypothetical protein
LFLILAFKINYLSSSNPIIDNKGLFWFYRQTHVKIKPMDIHTSPTITEPPITDSYQRHIRQRFWQIIAPVGFGILLVLVILALVIRTAVGTDAGGPVSQWADASVIWLSLPVLLFSLVLVLILFGMIYLLARLLKILPGYTHLMQHYVYLAAGFIAAWADKLVAPFISVKGFSASVSAFVGSLFGQRRD